MFNRWRERHGPRGAGVFRRDRTGEARGIALTQAGRVYYEYAQQAVRRKAEMRAQVAALNQDISGQMNVDASVLSIPIGRLYCDFLALHPLIQARIVHLGEQTRSNPPDIVITTRQLPASEWSGEQLLTELLLMQFSAEAGFQPRVLMEYYSVYSVTAGGGGRGHHGPAGAPSALRVD